VKHWALAAGQLEAAALVPKVMGALMAGWTRTSASSSNSSSSSSSSRRAWLLRLHHYHQQQQQQATAMKQFAGFLAWLDLSQRSPRSGLQRCAGSLG
jgi:hypothetical protein